MRLESSLWQRRRLVISNLLSPRFLAAGLGLLALMAGGGGTLLHAADATWAGPTGTQAWATDANWSPAAAPGATDSLVNGNTATFNSNVAGTAITIDPNRNIRNITFGAASTGAITFGSEGAGLGNALLLSSGGSFSTTLGNTSAITVNAPLIVQPTSGTGNGTYTFANNNVASSVTNDPNTNKIFINGGISGGTTTGAITLTFGGTAGNRSSDTSGNEVNGIISNGGAAGGVAVTVSTVNNQNGVWKFTNANNSYTGATTLGTGTLIFTSIANAGVNSSLGAGSSIVMGSGVHLKYAGPSASTDRAISGGGSFYNQTSGTTLTLTGTVTPGFTFRGNGNFDITSVVTGGSGFSRTDGGTVFLSNNANSFTGNISISDGAFRGATLLNSGVNSAFGRGTSITLGQGSNTVGRLEYTGVSTSTNRVIISRNDNNTQTAGAPSGRGIIDVTTAGETLTLTGGIRTSNATVANIGQITLSGAGNGEVQGQIGGTEANAAAVVSMRVLKDGSGTWTLTAANTYTRDTVVVNGVLNIRHGSALGTVLSNEAVPSAANAGTTVNSGATLQIQNDVSVGEEQLTLSGNGFAGQTGALVNVSGTNNYAGVVILAANATISSDAGRLNLTSATALNGSAASRTLTLAGAGDGSISAGLGANISTLTKNGTGAWTLAGTSAHTGATTVNAGLLNVAGTFTGNGATTVNATGTLNVTGSLTGTGITTVNNNGTLAGTGTLAGAVTVANGGTLSAGDAQIAGSTGTLTVNGNLVLNSTSILRFDLGSSSDLVVANAALTLDGVLSIGKGPGLTSSSASYQLFDYAGTLTDNGLTVSSMVGYDAVVSVDTANTLVNLNVTALAGQYWDGGDTAADGSVDGGSGVWTNAGTNWTSADGSTNTSWADAPVKVAFFEGATGGTVTVQDNVTVTGMQFGKDYTLAAGGGSIQTTTTATEMRVISGVTATVEAPVKGTGGINKTGEGTLVFTAAPGGNTYGGPTLITSGTLKIGATNTLPTTTALTIGAGVTTVGVLTDVGTLYLTDASQTVASLTIASNSTANNIVTIGAGQTLTVNGAGGFKVGIANTEKAQNRVVFNGAGSLVVDNTAANFESGLQGSLVLLPGGTTAFDNAANTNTSFTDLSALGSFTANVNEVRVGHGVVNTSTLTLSNTSNTITANTIQISNTVSYNAGSGTTSMILGAGTNVISTNTLNIGLAKGGGILKFASQTAGSAGTVVIGGKTTALVNIILGSSANVGTGASPGGTLDLRGHVATVTAGDILIGRRTSSGSGGTNGNVYFDAGTFTANKVEIGYMSGEATGNAIGQLTVGGGTFTVNTGGTFTLGTHANTTTAGSATGSVTISGGTLITNVDILEGGGTNSTTANTVTTINLSGGTLDMTGKNIGSATNTINNVNLTAGVLKDVGEINGGAAISKTGTGTLVIQGDSGYTGATTVAAGTLLASNDPHGTGSATGTNSVSVTGTATLGGNGRIAGNVTLASGTTLAPGGNATSIAGNVSGVSTDTGTLRIAGDLSVASGANLALNLKTSGNHGLNATFDPITNLLTSVSGTSTDGGNDRLIVGGAFGLDAASSITVTLGSGAVLGYQDTFDLLDWSGVDIPLSYYDNGDGLRTGGTADNALWNLDLPDLAAFNAGWIWDVSQFGSTGVIAIVPEPSRAVLMLMGLAGLMLRRRRRA